MSRKSSSAIAVIGIDIGKNSFHVVGHDQRAVAARRHECAFERPERKALAVHQFGQNLGNVLRRTRRDRYVMDRHRLISG